MVQKTAINGLPKPFGLAARYDSEERFIRAVHRVADAGYRYVEVYSPFHIENLTDVFAQRRSRSHWAVLAGGIFGGTAGFFMQYFAYVLDTPLNVGGRPFNSVPAFIPITFELTVLFAALSGFAAFLISCGLPRLHHPIFSIPDFERATMDRFFICILARDINFHPERTKKLLEDTRAEDVYVVEQDN